MSLKVLAVATFTSVFVNAAAHAVTITVTDATGATSSPFVLANFGTSSSNGLVSTAPIMLSNAVITFTPNVSNPQAGMYSGSVVIRAPRRSPVQASPQAIIWLPSRTIR